MTGTLPSRSFGHPKVSLVPWVSGRGSVSQEESR